MNFLRGRGRVRHVIAPPLEVQAARIVLHPAALILAPDGVVHVPQDPHSICERFPEWDLRTGLEEASESPDDWSKQAILIHATSVSVNSAHSKCLPLQALFAS